MRKSQTHNTTNAFGSYSARVTFPRSYYNIIISMKSSGHDSDIIIIINSSIFSSTDVVGVFFLLLLPFHYLCPIVFNVEFVFPIPRRTSNDSSYTTIVSTLKIKHVQKTHSGNYTCLVGSPSASAAVTIHILNGKQLYIYLNIVIYTVVCSFFITLLLLLSCTM